VTTQQNSHTWDDGIDLREYIGVIFRRKWLILVLAVLAIAVAGILSYMVLPPTYESSLVVSLPAADGGDGFGMNPQAYEEFAASPSVEAAVEQSLGSQPNPGRFAARYDTQLDQNARLLTVRTSARTAQEALLAATLWTDAFYGEVLAAFQEQITREKVVAQRAVEDLLVEVTKAEDVRATFDKENPISLMETRLSSMESELVDDERRFRELTLFSIPTDEARLAFLEDFLSIEPETLSGSLTGVVAPEQSSGAGVTSSDITILNPVYLQLSQDLAATRTRLVTSQKEAETLEDRISSLQDEADRLRNTVVTAKAERNRLDRNQKEIEALYEPARSELDRLLAIEPRLPELARPRVVSKPTLPAAAVAPRKGLNMALSGVVAILLGVVIAFFLEWYRGEQPAAVVTRQEAVTSSSPSDS